MLAWQDLLLEDLGAATLVYPGYLEDLGRIHVGIGAAAHDGDAADHAFVDLDAATRCSVSVGGKGGWLRTWTEE